MTDDELRKLLKDNGVSDADAIPENKLCGYRTMTRGITDSVLLTKKIKDWRKIVYASLSPSLSNSIAKALK